MTKYSKSTIDKVKLERKPIFFFLAEMAGNCKIMPAMLPVAVPVSIDGSSDAGGTIWRRKYRALKKKCEEFEQVGTKSCVVGHLNLSVWLC